MKIFLLINVLMPTTVGIAVFMRGKKNNILGLFEPENAEFLDIFSLAVFKENFEVLSFT